VTRRLGAAAAAVAVLATGCSATTSTSQPLGAARHAPVTVFAASSLTNAFTALGARYKDATGGPSTFSFAGSQDLVAQISNGAPADVLATADTKTMSSIASHLVGSPHVLARNRLVIVTAPGNPHHIRTLHDLAAHGLTVVLADPSVPAGKYAAAALETAHVTVHPASLELEVRGVLTKVELGEADTGVVYVTDAESAGAKVTAVPIADTPVATYEIAALTPAGAKFVAFALSGRGQDVLRKFGFLPP
jgi:molybdate transport system substrate-binding protein